MLRPSKDWKIVNHYIHFKSWCILNPIWDNHNILLHLKAKSFIVWHVFIVQSRYIIIPPAISMAAFIGLALILFPCLCLVRYTNYLYIQGVQEFGYFETSKLYKIPQTPISLETYSNDDSKYMSCIESSISIECSGGLEIDGLSPFSVRPKHVWVGEMLLFLNKNSSIYFIRHEFCI